MQQLRTALRFFVFASTLALPGVAAATELAAPAEPAKNAANDADGSGTHLTASS